MNCVTCINFYFSFIGLCTRVEELISFLQMHDVLPQSIDCPTCNKPCVLNQDTSHLRFRCRRTSKVYKKRTTKRFSFSAKKGTFFDGSHLDITTICQFVCHWLHSSYPRQRFICQQLQMTPVTVVYWSHFCRQVCIDYLTRNSVILGGEGVTVEIDEAKIGKRKYNQGRRIEAQWIFGGFEPVARRKSSSFQLRTVPQVIRKYIKPGISAPHHSLTFVDPVTGAHTQNIERLWRGVRGGISQYWRKKGHMVGYLAEFMFKRSVDPANLIHEFMRAAATLYPPSGPTTGEEPPDEPRPGPSSAP
ncbi:hypothetical protein RI129_002766 [Pyrocoelia pectoralis]|uniref:ISXO2-like transposase domain-containing protein n=1 Tax=Pyrocoelia pectoralis TaxID=417401 RepID=A0AAN7VKB5_9COLE